MTPIYIESGSKRVFACALDWPGWCRADRTEAAAMAALGAYAARYAVVAKEAGIKFPIKSASEFTVVDRIPGSGTTDFGAPCAWPPSDGERLTPTEADRFASLLEASWTVFDRVVSGAPASLRKGPRGGGRDRDEIVRHVIDAEGAYAPKIGIRGTAPAELRRTILETLRGSVVPLKVAEKGWPPRYAARRMAWHVLDHAWEIEDRRE
ncbi:MAG TPA: hypothetical protein VIN39_01665 [Candidatus Dormibacteraeota bacterium]